MPGRGLRETFERSGLVRLEGCLPREAVERARQVVYDALEARGILVDGRWRYDVVAELPWHQRDKEAIGGVRQSPVFRELVTPAVLEAIGGLVGGRVAPMLDAPQLLFSLPNAESWSVPPRGWHTDLHRLPHRGCPGVQMFTFLDTVRAGGGGTVVVAGAHRLLDGLEWLGAKEIKAHLSELPWFRELLSKAHTDRDRFLEPERIGDAEVRVVELVGEPGDVCLMDLRLLHAPAPNASASPRMMVSQRFLVEDMKRELEALLASVKGS